MAKAPSIRLPEQWSRHVKAGILHAIALAGAAMVAVWPGFETRPAWLPTLDANQTQTEPLPGGPAILNAPCLPTGR